MKPRLKTASFSSRNGAVHGTLIVIIHKGQVIEDKTILVCRSQKTTGLVDVTTNDVNFRPEVAAGVKDVEKRIAALKKEYGLGDD